MSLKGQFGRRAGVSIVMAMVAAFAVSSVVRVRSGEAADPALEERAPLHFTNAQHRFSIAFPSGWVQMPSALVDALAGAMPSAAPKGGAVCYGFELESNTNSMALPYVTVQVLQAGRIGDGYLRMLNNPEVRRRAVLDLVKKDGLSEHDLQSADFDTNRFRLRFTAEQTDQAGVKVRLWHAIVFTERGSINVSCFADGSAPGPGNWGSLFDGVLDSLVIHPSLAYRPQSASGNVEGAKFRASSVLLIPGLMVLVGVARLVGRRFGGDVRSDEI